MSISNSLKKCPSCQSLYQMRRYKIAMRDKDSIKCEVCGATLHSWNGAEMFDAILLKKVEIPKID